MRRLKPKKTLTIQPFNLSFIGLTVALLMLFAISMLFKPSVFGEIKLELPRGEASVIVLDEDPIIVNIRKNEKIYLNNEDTQLNSLSKKILEASNNRLDTKIFVRADRELSFDKIVKVISVINAKGFGNVSLVINISKDL
jgi:biopolymer transport protein TolR